jgi:hypothetical protein
LTETLEKVSRLFLCPFWLPQKKQGLLWRRERCVTHFPLSILFFVERRFVARSSRLESGFQDRLIESLKALFPGCMVFKMDQIQGLPDLLILYGEKWASLECKRSATAKKRPNQDYYVEKMNDMSFSRFVCPENKEEVLNELQQAFQP